jgi:hypothetical protein
MNTLTVSSRPNGKSVLAESATAPLSGSGTGLPLGGVRKASTSFPVAARSARNVVCAARKNLWAE